MNLAFLPEENCTRTGDVDIFHGYFVSRCYHQSYHQRISLSASTRHPKIQLSLCFSPPPPPSLTHIQNVGKTRNGFCFVCQPNERLHTVSQSTHTTQRAPNLSCPAVSIRTTRTFSSPRLTCVTARSIMIVIGFTANVPSWIRCKMLVLPTPLFPTITTENGWRIFFCFSLAKLKCLSWEILVWMEPGWGGGNSRRIVPGNQLSRRTWNKGISAGEKEKQFNFTFVGLAFLYRESGRHFLIYSVKM